MRVAFINPPHRNSLGRGIGFLNQRLLDELKKIKGLEMTVGNCNDCDLVHFSYFDEFFFTLPLFISGKFIVTIPDFTKLKFPQHFPLGLRAKIAWPIQKTLVSRAAGIITISQSAKRDIEEFLGYPAAKIFVTYLAADSAFHPISDTLILSSIKVKYHLPEKFVLYVGGVNWNKNLPALIRACQKTKMNLVLVGQELVNENIDFSHPENQSFREVLNLIKDDQKVLRLGFVPTADLAAIYNLASVCVQPSVYEGFGLPVLEAMAAGCPVICGRNSSFPEVAGEAAVYADVTDPSALSEKMTKVLKLPMGEQEKLIQKGLAQAAKFSWEKTARETYEIYRKVVAG